MLGKVKRLLTISADSLGVTSLFLNSEWRRQRLVILCYHGVSIEDEHRWEPAIYFPPEKLRQRFETLRRRRCNVLPLEDAINRLYAGTLPPRSVVLTFDDGTYDNYAVAAPIIDEFGYPVTLYFTTYYSMYNRPVFDVMCSYLLWKAGPKRFALPGVLEGTTDLSQVSFRQVAQRVKEYAFSARMSAPEKDRLLGRLAESLGLDYEAICASRILQVMTTSEARELADRGYDIQLHTHRHRVSRRRALFQREIVQNRQYIQAVTNTAPRHFCYPCGVWLDDYPRWLGNAGVVSATTCDPGLATRDTDPYLLPRFLDASSRPDAEFGAWISGFTSILPQRSGRIFRNDQFIEEEQPDLVAGIHAGLDEAALDPIAFK
jgi:peptidoglycan/xylan/chitin deacetylase (PgdA/CDA1 family)